MVHFTEVDGVIFCEESLPGTAIGPISARAPSQNTTLADLKRDLARQVKAKGGDALINFKYGQRADKGLSLLNPFKWDTERQIASGDVVTLIARPSS